jgi:hypothetical protein
MNYKKYEGDRIYFLQLIQMIIIPLQNEKEYLENSNKMVILLLLLLERR